MVCVGEIVRRGYEIERRRRDLGIVTLKVWLELKFLEGVVREVGGNLGVGVIRVYCRFLVCG